MTANQVAYWQLQESKRHNLETEAMTDFQNRAQAKRYDAQSEADLRNATSREREATTKERDSSTKEKEAETNRMVGTAKVVDLSTHAAKNVSDTVKNVADLFKPKTNFNAAKFLNGFI